MGTKSWYVSWIFSFCVSEFSWNSQLVPTLPGTNQKSNGYNYYASTRFRNNLQILRQRIWDGMYHELCPTCSYLCIHICTQVYAYIHNVYSHAHMYAHMYTNATRIRMRTCIHICIHTKHTFTRIHALYKAPPVLFPMTSKISWKTALYSFERALYSNKRAPYFVII